MPQKRYYIQNEIKKSHFEKNKIKWAKFQT